MRRSDREITDIPAILGIISECAVCRLGMALNNMPYVVPLNFGWVYEDQELSLYFHGAREGHKLDILRQNPEVCVEMDTGHQLIPGDTAGKYGYAYRSVIGFGTVEFVGDAAEKVRGLTALMHHQTGRDGNDGGHWQFSPADLDRVCVYKARLRSFTAKSRPLPPR
ncbi:MAG: pyridoxamine 5'-phosphate oxidase family protein [Spirochaetaceae bacterium]|jgi:nitroimidazol reductase NimA-like FMN-containing flavoprotein (pyridoxamine 5'-phosphate oxidase superfamily)|nr:pyridoxamine 5'-phosphate oxidase family protein [Spirochaetaceae bacterium]